MNYEQQIDEIIVKAITDFNIRDSGGMSDTKNINLSVAEARRALLELLNEARIDELETLIIEVPKTVGESEPHLPYSATTRTGVYVFNRLNQLKSPNQTTEDYYANGNSV